MKMLLANAEAWPGFETTVDLLKQGGASIDAMVSGIAKVEREAKVRSVGEDLPLAASGWNGFPFSMPSGFSMA